MEGETRYGPMLPPPPTSHPSDLYGVQPRGHTDELAARSSGVHSNDDAVLELERQGGGAVRDLNLHLSRLIVCPLPQKLRRLRERQRHTRIQGITAGR